jgi:hypothetical protein
VERCGLDEPSERGLRLAHPFNSTDKTQNRKAS